MRSVPGRSPSRHHQLRKVSEWTALVVGCMRLTRGETRSDHDPVGLLCAPTSSRGALPVQSLTPPCFSPSITLSPSAPSSVVFVFFVPEFLGPISRRGCEFPRCSGETATESFQVFGFVLPLHPSIENFQKSRGPRNPCFGVSWTAPGRLKKVRERPERLQVSSMTS